MNFYPSNGIRIRNAISGKYYPYQRGSIDELRLFHVTDATGYINGSDEISYEPQHYYYQSPKEYESVGGIIDQDTMERWLKKVLQFPVEKGDGNNSDNDNGDKYITIK